MVHRLFLILLFLFGTEGAFARDLETGFLDRAVEINAETRHYQIFVPRAYDPARKWPVILFLHGSRQTGTDGYEPTSEGIGNAIRKHADRYPAIVLFPQAHDGKQWVDSEAALAVATLDAAEKEFSTDGSRIYLTGLSRGGRGVYHIAYRHIDRFAAILPVCGHIDEFEGRLPPLTPPDKGDVWEELARRFSETPAWVFHGDADPIIPVEQSRKLVVALKSIDAPVRYTELVGVEHNSWDAAYESDEVIQWLLSQRRDTR